jgi:hypothetical protein
VVDDDEPDIAAMTMTNKITTTAAPAPTQTQGDFKRSPDFFARDGTTACSGA